MYMNNNSQQFYSPNPYPTRTNSNGINWVQGIEGAKAYPLMPNSNTILLDSESERFYIKSSDSVGMCSLRIFDYSEVKEPTKNDYVTRAELNNIIESLRTNNEQTISRDEPKINSKQHKQSTVTSGSGVD